MANSLIDDVMQDSFSGNSNNSGNDGPVKRKSKGGLVFFLLILIIAIVGGLVAFIFLNKPDNTSAKTAFLGNVYKNNLNMIFTSDILSNLDEKLASESFETDSNIKLNLNIYGTEIKNVDLNVKSQTDKENSKSYAKAALNYMSNELFNLEFLTSKDAVGIKSDEIVSAYIGSDYENLPKMLQKVFNINFATSESNINDNGESNSNLQLDSIEMDEVLDVLNTKIEVPENAYQKYVDILNKNVDASAFSQKDVTLARDTGNVDATEYTMTLNEQTTIDILTQVLQTLETDDELLNALFGGFSDLGISIDTIKIAIDNYINSLLSVNTSESKNYVFKVYVANNQTLKMTIDFAGETTIDIEYVYGDNLNSISYTILKPEDKIGYTMKLQKEVADVSESLELEVDMIKDNEIISKFLIDSNLTGSEKSYDIESSISYSEDDINVNIDMENKIDFKNTEVEDLNDENCLFLNTLSDDEFDSLMDQITNKTNEVITNKMAKLLMIDTNLNPTVVQQQTNGDDEDKEAKENAKNTLIQAISNEMGIANSEGRQYTIQDLQNLSIDGHELEVSISSNIAVVTIDGYVFNIDSDFYISE